MDSSIDETFKRRLGELLSSLVRKQEKIDTITQYLLEDNETKLYQFIDEEIPKKTQPELLQILRNFRNEDVYKQKHRGNLPSLDLSVLENRLKDHVISILIQYSVDEDQVQSEFVNMIFAGNREGINEAIDQNVAKREIQATISEFERLFESDDYKQYKIARNPQPATGKNHYDTTSPQAPNSLTPDKKAQKEEAFDRELCEFKSKLDVVKSFKRRRYDENLIKIYVGEDRAEKSRSQISDHSIFELELIAQIIARIKHSPFMDQFKGLLPYVFDLLKRRRPFDELAKELTKAKVEFFQDLDIQDLFALFIEHFEPSTQAKIGEFLVKGNYPIPLFYKAGPSSNDWKANFSLCHDLLLETDRPLLTMIGTGEPCGVTTLLSNLCSLDEENVSSQPDGITHNGSVSLYLNTAINSSKVIIADVHGYRNDPSFIANCKLLFNFSTIVVLNVTAQDAGTFNDETKPLFNLLQALQREVVVKKRGFVLVLWRDFDENHRQCIEKFVNHLKSAFGERYLDLQKVPNLDSLRKKKKQFTIEIERLQTYFELELQKYTDPIYHTHSITLWESIFKEGLSSSSTKIQSYYYSNPKDPSIQKYSQLLDSLVKNQQQDLLNALFPYLASNYRKWEKQAQLKTLTRRMDREFHNYNNLNPQKEQIEKEIQKISAEDKGRILSKFGEELFNVLKDRENLIALKAFEKAILSWKMPIVDPKITKWIQLTTKILQDADSLEPSKIEDMKKQIKSLEDEIQNFDISLDSGISELICAYEARKSHGKEFASLENCLTTYFNNVIDSGSPINLIDGKTLVYGNKLLEEFIKSIPNAIDARYYVVSVIGAQSSAKSTLLNYLFGCGFATSAGRCTKGLYFTLVKLPESINIIIIDTEGLLSVCARDNLFDNKVVTMALTVAHAVIINNKGELTATLRNLLEVCLYALKAMGKKKFRTKILFALRDHSDDNVSVQEQMLNNLLKDLDSAAAKYSINFREFLDIGDDAIILLPNALDKQESFSSKVFRLRESLYYTVRQYEEKYTSVHDFYSFGELVWKSIEKCGNDLLNYSSMLEIEIKEALSQLKSETVSKFREELIISSQELRDLLLKKETTKSEDYVVQTDRAFIDIIDRAHNYFNNEAKNGKKYGDTQAWKDYARELIEGELRYTKNSLLKDWEFHFNKKKKEEQKTSIRAQIHEDFSKLREEGKPTNECISLFLGRLNDLYADLVKKIILLRKQDSDIAKKVQECYDQSKDKRSRTLKYFPYFLLTDIPHLQYRNKDLGYHDLKKYILKSFKDFLASVQNIFKNEGEAQRAFTAEIRDFEKVLREGKSTSTISIQQLMDQCFASFEKLIKNMSMNLDKSALASDLFSLAVGELYHIEKEREEIIFENEIKALKMTCEEEKQNYVKLIQSLENSYDSGVEIANQVFQMLFTQFTSRLIAILQDSLARDLNNVLPGPLEANKYAYENSFISKNFKNVYKYVTNINKFIKELYDDRSLNSLKNLIDQKIGHVRNHFNDLARSLSSIAETWENSLTQEKPQISKNSDQLWESFVQALTTTNPELNPYLESRVLLSKPANAVNYKEFSSGFQKTIAKKLAESAVEDRIEKELNQELRKYLKERWTDICGCQVRCPTCGNKCQNANDNHTQHKATFHFFPSFTGVRDILTGHLVLGHCFSRDNICCQWNWHGDLVNSFDDVIAKYHPDWRNEFPRTNEPGKFEAYVDVAVKECWVGVKELIKQRYSGLVDNTPSEWVNLVEEGRRLKTFGDDLNLYY